MAPKQRLSCKVRDTFVDLTSGEEYYAVDGIIAPALSARSYPELINCVIIRNVHIGNNAWPFYSGDLCNLLQARLRWYRKLPSRLQVTVLIRLVPNTDPDWPGPSMPEVIGVSVKSLKKDFHNEHCAQMKDFAPV